MHIGDLVITMGRRGDREICRRDVGRERTRKGEQGPPQPRHFAKSDEPQQQGDQQQTS